MSLVPKKVVWQIHLRSRALIINFLLLSTQVPPLDLICHEVQLSGDLAFVVYLAKARPVCYKSRPNLRYFLASNLCARFLFISLILHEVVQYDI